MENIKKKSDYLLHHVRLSVCLSAWNNSASTGRVLMKIGLSTFRKSVEKIYISLKSDNNKYFTWTPT